MTHVLRHIHWRDKKDDGTSVAFQNSSWTSTGLLAKNAGCNAERSSSIGADTITFIVLP